MSLDCDELRFISVASLGSGMRLGGPEILITPTVVFVHWIGPNLARNFEQYCRNYPWSRTSPVSRVRGWAQERTEGARAGSGSQLRDAHKARVKDQSQSVLAGESVPTRADGLKWQLQPTA